MGGQVSEDEGGLGIRSIERACDIVDLLGRARSPMSLPDISRESGIPKSSAFRILNTLESKRFVERVSAAGYRLGSGILALSRGRAEDLVTRFDSVLVMLRDQFQETANLGFLDGAEVAYLRIVESLRGVRLAARPSDRDYLHCTALGKALLAPLSDAAALGLIGTSYIRRTDRTITDWEALRVELAKVRQQGYAVDDEENEHGGRCVAVHIPGTSAAISVSAPTDRLPRSDVPRVAARIAELIT